MEISFGCDEKGYFADVHGVGIVAESADWESFLAQLTAWLQVNAKKRIDKREARTS